MLLADDGLITMEFPHLMRLIQENQFDKATQDLLIRPFSTKALQQAAAISDQLVEDGRIRAEQVRELPAPSPGTATTLETVSGRLAAEQNEKNGVTTPRVSKVQSDTQAIIDERDRNR